MGLAGLIVIALASTGLAAEPEYVLIKGDAALFSQPDGDDDKAKLAKRVNLEEQPHRVYYAEILERSDGWVKVRTANYRGACTRPLAVNAPAGLVVWVRPNALVKATTRQFELTDGDTTVTVWPGLPIDENVDASITVAAKGLTVTGPVPLDAVGNRYRPVDPGRSDRIPSHGATGTFGTESLKIEADDAPANSLGGDRWALERRCLRVEAPRLTGEAPTPGGGSPEGGRTGTARRIPNAWAIKPGTPLVWPDMVDAGESTHHYRLAQDEEEDPKGLVCGTIPPGLTVCAADPAAGGALPGPVRHIALDLKATHEVTAKHPKGEVKGEDARCRVQIDVGPKGNVQEVDVRACEEAFREAATEAVKAWTFQPHKVDGQAVPARTYAFVAFEG